VDEGRDEVARRIRAAAGRAARIAFAAVAPLVAGCGGDRPAPGADRSGAPAARPNLVLYVVDTLRADRLGCYGHDRPTSPRLDAFAAGAVRIAEARAQSSWTKPAMATLLTGVYPVTHGAMRRASGIAPEVVTLAERLRDAGYETAMFTTNPTVVAKFGFDRGFDHYAYLHTKEGRKRRSVRSVEIHAAVVEWLGQRARDETRPFFLVVHTLDPHDPYRPAREFRERLAPGVDVESSCCLRVHELRALAPEAAARRTADSLALYDAEIAANDASFGMLIDELVRRALLDGSAILFTADHGEEFLEHGGWRHAETLFEEVIRIPFVLRLPAGLGAGTVLPGPADQIDVAPTLLELAGVAIPPELPGGSWLPAIAGGAPPARESLAWLEHPAFSVAAIRDGDWKWIRHDGAHRDGAPSGASEWLFDLAADPTEGNDRLATEAERRRDLARRSRDASQRFRLRGAASEAEIDETLDEELKALGYL
jgi:arylsulfatase A-like enzyme